MKERNHSNWTFVLLLFLKKYFAKINRSSQPKSVLRTAILYFFIAKYFVISILKVQLSDSAILE